MPSIQYQSFHCPKNGCGVNHGVGARRIVSEWTGLDFEARKFTAKILGDEMENSEPPTSTSSETSSNNRSSEDQESKAEL
ncbi:hypothetical protein V6N13_005472 [Hibiscus sabdariffa]